MSTPGFDEDHEALLQFLYMAPIGLLQARIDGEVLMANPVSAQLLLPLAPDGTLGNLYETLASVAPDLRHRVEAFDAPHGSICDALPLVVNGGSPARRQAQVLSLTLLKLDPGRVMAVLADITQSVQRDQALRHHQAWIDSLISGLTDYALVTLDGRGRVGSWNPSVGRVTGQPAEATVGRSLAVFYPPDTMPESRLLDRLHEADSQGWSLDEGWRQRADGSRYWGNCLIAPLHAPGETAPEERAYSLILRDVSDRREASEALWRSVSCDHLTGLANRRAFFEAAGRELQRWHRTPRPLSIAMIDIDHFKRVNDRHGHAAGDALLRDVAAGLAATFRHMDVVARLGGEEFAVLLPGAGVDDADAVAHRLCQHIATRGIEVGGATLRCTVSVGLATMQADVPGVDALLQRADRALYAAKAAGRNRVEHWHEGLAEASAAQPQPA